MTSRVRTYKYLVAATIGFCAVLAFGLTAKRVEAIKLKAGIFLTQSKIPGNLTEAGLIGFVKNHKTQVLNETSGGEIKNRKWIADVMIAFNAPPGDLEYATVFFDVTDGPRQLIQEMSTFVNDRSKKTYLQRIALERPRFKPNRKLEMAVVVHHEEVGFAKFRLSGEEPRRTGDVSFTDDETKEK